MSPQLRFRTNRCVALAGLLWLGITSVGNAQFPLILQPPWPPTNLTPLPGTYEARVKNPPTLTATWGQFLASGMVLRPVATHFIICFVPVTGTTTPACTVNNAMWTRVVQAPAAGLTASGSTFSFTLRNPANTGPRSLNSAELDRPMRFTVGACSQLVDRSCVLRSTDLYYSSMNIAAEPPSEFGSNASDWQLSANASNLSSISPSSTSDTPTFGGSIEVYEVLKTGAAGVTCATDINDPNVRNDASVWAIDSRATQTPVPDLPRTNGVYSGPAIVGLYRVGSLYINKPFSGFVGANAPLGSLIAAPAIFPIANAGQSRTFVVVSTFDVGYVVTEFNESDNNNARCKRR